MLSVVEKRLKEVEATERLGLGARQVKRLARRYRERGAAGMVLGHRGRRPNNALAAEVQQAALSLVRERYWDFGPTFAAERLAAGHRLSVWRSATKLLTGAIEVCSDRAMHDACSHRAGSTRPDPATAAGAGGRPRTEARN